MAIDEAQGRILDYESCYDCTLVPEMSMHTPLYRGDSNVFKGRNQDFSHEDAGKEPNQVFRVLDNVPFVGKRALDL
jgi:hypothetical protein